MNLQSQQKFESNSVFYVVNVYRNKVVVQKLQKNQLLDQFQQINVAVKFVTDYCNQWKPPVFSFYNIDSYVCGTELLVSTSSGIVVVFRLPDLSVIIQYEVATFGISMEKSLFFLRKQGQFIHGFSKTGGLHFYANERQSFLDQLALFGPKYQSKDGQKQVQNTIITAVSVIRIQSKDLFILAGNNTIIVYDDISMQIVRQVVKVQAAKIFATDLFVFYKAKNSIFVQLKGQLFDPEAELLEINLQNPLISVQQSFTDPKQIILVQDCEISLITFEVTSFIVGNESAETISLMSISSINVDQTIQYAMFVNSNTLLINDKVFARIAFVESRLSISYINEIQPQSYPIIDAIIYKQNHILARTANKLLHLQLLNEIQYISDQIQFKYDIFSYQSQVVGCHSFSFNNLKFFLTPQNQFIYDIQSEELNPIYAEKLLSCNYSNVENIRISFKFRAKMLLAYAEDLWLVNTFITSLGVIVEYEQRNIVETVHIYELIVDDFDEDGFQKYRFQSSLKLFFTGNFVMIDNFVFELKFVGTSIALYKIKQFDFQIDTFSVVENGFITTSRNMLFRQDGSIKVFDAKIQQVLSVQAQLFILTEKSLYIESQAGTEKLNQSFVRLFEEQSQLFAYSQQAAFIWKNRAFVQLNQIMHFAVVTNNIFIDLNSLKLFEIQDSPFSVINSVKIQISTKNTQKRSSLIPLKKGKVALISGDIFVFDFNFKLGTLNQVQMMKCDYFDDNFVVRGRQLEKADGNKIVQLQEVPIKILAYGEILILVFQKKIQLLKDIIVQTEFEYVNRFYQPVSATNINNVVFIQFQFGIQCFRINNLLEIFQLNVLPGTQNIMGFESIIINEIIYIIMRTKMGLNVQLYELKDQLVLLSAGTYSGGSVIVGFKVDGDFVSYIDVYGNYSTVELQKV